MTASASDDGGTAANGERPRGRARRWSATAAALAVALAVGWWGGRATLADDSSAAVAAPERVVAEVVESSVGRALSLNVTVSQPFSLLATNTLAGVVTVVSDGDVGLGDQLYVVGDTPVRAVPGDVPFWRDLAQGARGKDVTQLQSALAGLGFLRDAPDGVFAASTASAVRTWQRATGAPTTGAVPLGVLVAVPSLPATVRLGEDVVLGGVLTGGEPGVLGRGGEPRFGLVVSQDQAALIPPDATVQVAFEDLTWPAVVAGTSADDSATTTLELTAPDGSAVCGADCTRLPAEETVSLRAQVTIVPEVSGPGVPAAAVHTDAAGAAHVTAEDGTPVPVRVLASGDGIAIVDGLQVGDRVIVLGDEPRDASDPGAGAGEAPGGEGDDG